MQKILLLLIAAIFLSAFHFGSLQVSGTVSDEQGNPLENATVALKGSSIATLTNIYGKYALAVDKANAVLVFSAPGYVSKEVKVGNATIVDVTLSPVQEMLQEVVVTGYAKKTKRMTISAPSVSTNALQGRVAGVTINGQGKSVRQNKDAFNTEDYDAISENGFKRVMNDPLSTFSIDVDAASYSNVRRFLNQGQLPPAGAVRIEEMINYFRYSYEDPKDEHPFSIYTESASCPWNTKHQLVMIGLQAKKIAAADLPPSNLVFLIDVSGSMYGPTRLGLVKSSMKMLVDQLREQDKISIVVYAGSAGLVLPATSGSEKIKIKDALERLEAGGSTAGGAGIQLAYKVAKEQFIKEGNNRVILCTDGDFNVGASSDDALERMIEKERESGVFLTVLGYGMGNYKDNKMQKLARIGNGNHAYIDDIKEAKKVLVSEFGGTIHTIAKDVKLQVEFNPAKVAGYRLIGYENRLLNKEDFNDDKKDAGDLGSGHTVTALYEIIPVGVKSEWLKDADPLKYQAIENTPQSISNDLLTVKFRYKHPDKNKSLLLEKVVSAEQKVFEKASENLRFSASVASFGMLLRNSTFRGSSSYNMVLGIASRSRGKDVEGYRREFIDLVKKAAKLSQNELDEDIVMKD